MNFPNIPKKKADSISNGILLILLGILFFTNTWWPGILFAIGISFATRQYLTARRYDFFITLLLLILLSLMTLIGLTFSYLIPILLIGIGVFMVSREYFFNEGFQFLNRNKKDRE